MKKLLLCFLPVTLVIAGCQEEEKPTDVRKPGVSLFQPHDSVDTFASGQAMVIQALVTDNDRLKDVYVELSKADTIVLDYHVQPEVASYSIDTTYTFSTTAETDYTLRITAEDFTTNTYEFSRTFHVMP